MNEARRVLLDGALVVVPLGAILLLVVAIIGKLHDATEPVSGPIGHPIITGVVLFVVLCALVGLLVRSAAGRRARRTLEGALFEKIPGYRLVKAYAGEGAILKHAGMAMRPALAATDDALCPALVMDQLADGRFVVFVPGVPAPMSGALYVFTPDRVQVLDTPLLPFLKAFSSWGLGLREIIEAQQANPATPARPA